MTGRGAAARLAPLLRLPVGALEALAASLRDGVLSEAITQPAVEQVAGTDAAAVTALLRDLAAEGIARRHLALVVDGIAAAVSTAPKPTSLFDLVLSGPDLPGVPTGDTAAVMHTIVRSANREILLVGYAIHDGKRLFEPLARRMAEVPGLAVTFCLDIQRAWNDPTPAAELVARFAREFRTRHWPWERLPALYYDPRSLEVGDSRASLHAKCVVADREQALVTSANFTDAAQRRNIEVGVVLRHPASAARLADHFAGLIGGGLLARCPLG